MDANRLSTLYRDYGPVIYWRCRTLLRDDAAAEDATQETFLRVVRHLDRAPDADDAVRWIWRIATNYCLNQVRDRARDPEPRAELPEVPVALRVEDQLADRDLARRLIARTGAKLRAVAWAHFVDGLDHVEAARMLGLSRKTVASRLADFEARARKFVGRQP